MEENNRGKSGKTSGTRRPAAGRTHQTGTSRTSGQTPAHRSPSVRTGRTGQTGQEERQPANSRFLTKRRQQELKRQRIQRMRFLGAAAGVLILVVVLIVVAINVFSGKPSEEGDKKSTPEETVLEKSTPEGTTPEETMEEKSPEDASDPSEEGSDDVSAPSGSEGEGTQGTTAGNEQNPEGNPAGGEQNPEGNPAGGETVYATTNVNIRSIPDTSGDILTTLLAGQSIVRLSEENGWSRVDYQGTEAYIFSEYLTTQTPGAPQATEAPQPEGVPATAAVPAEIAHSTEWPKTADGLWDLTAIRNDETPIVPTQPIVGFGYSAVNRDPVTNIPTDWAYYEKHWGMFNVDWIQQNSFNTNKIYLTMDEGFPNTNTATILDTLKEKNVKAAFFITKNFLDGCPELVQRMIAEGHTVGNHTCTHPSMPTLSIEEQTNQIMTLHNMVQEQFGYEMKLFRFPQGNYTSQSLALVDNLGYKSVFWSYGYNDYDKSNQMEVSVALQNALDALHPGAIYLLHADSETNMQMLGAFIDGVRAKGFEFEAYPLTAN